MVPSGLGAGEGCREDVVVNAVSGLSFKAVSSLGMHCPSALSGSGYWESGNQGPLRVLLSLSVKW